MKFIKIYALLFCFVLGFSQAPNVQWNKTYGGSTKDLIKNIVTIPSGFLVLGFSNSPVSGDKTVLNGAFNTNDVWVLNLDSNFNLQTQFSYNHSNPNSLLNDFDTNVHQDNNMLYFATTRDDFDLYKSSIFQFDLASLNNNILFPGNISPCTGNQTYIDAVIANYFKTSDASYLYTATNGLTMATCASFSSSSYLIQKSSSTNFDSVIWTKEYGGDNFEELKTTLETPSGFLLVGNSNSNISQDKTENCRGLLDFWIIQTDNLGNILWQKTIGGNNDDSIASAVLLNDGFLIGGTSSSIISGEKAENSIGGKDYWILKLDFNGNIIWQKTIGGNQDDILKKIFRTNDGNMLLVGNSNSNSSGNKTENSKGNFDAWLVKIDSNGTVLWDKTIGGNLDESINDAIQTPNNGYVLAITSNSTISGDKTENSQGDSDYWLVKLTPDILSNNTFSNNLIFFSPNPTSEILNIATGTNDTISNVEIYSINGSLVKKIISDNIQSITVSDLQTGIYFVKLQMNNQVLNYKFLKK